MIATKRRLTEEELLALPDDGRKHEYVDGEMTDVPTDGPHEDLIMVLAYLLTPHAWKVGRIYGSGLGCWMRNGNLRSPDISIIRRERLPGGRSSPGFFHGAPDLCVEVISPSERKADMDREVGEYMESGARQVWQVFAAAYEIVVHDLSGETRVYRDNDEMTGGDIIPGFRLRVADLFEEIA